MKPDLETAKFSAQNAYFFASLCKIAYKPEQEAKGLMKGNSTYEGLGFDRFHWFDVRFQHAPGVETIICTVCILRGNVFLVEVV